MSILVPTHLHIFYYCLGPHVQHLRPRSKIMMFVRLFIHISELFCRNHQFKLRLIMDEKACSMPSLELSLIFVNLVGKKLYLHIMSLKYQILVHTHSSQIIRILYVYGPFQYCFLLISYRYPFLIFSWYVGLFVY